MHGHVVAPLGGLLGAYPPRLAQVNFRSEACRKGDPNGDHLDAPRHASPDSGRHCRNDASRLLWCPGAESRRRAPKLPIENGASLRVLRPARFVEPDETIFRANTAKFQQTTGIETRVDFVGWEDIRQQTAVASNTGTGPDIVIGWADDPHVYVDKMIELSDVAEYLGKRYGGWSFLGEKYGKRDKTNNWIGIPFGGTTGPIVYRRSAVKEAGFDKIPNDHAEYLKLCQALKKINKPAGFALGNAVGDGNGFAQWLIWSHGGYLLDEAGKVAINSKETVAALTYLKDLYPTFISGTLSWGDPSNNRAYAAGDCWLTANGVSLYFALKNDPAQRAIAEDTEHQALPFGVVGKAPQTATDAERHAVPAQQVSRTPRNPTSSS